ncbi:hypothetical protein [Marinobacter sp. AL4B]|uniref:hypothetical protein n=1 Tax=Marinobacter sp. AL4B TaxID=2871173 RepID=UPI001CAA629A|nr:hypothetical protein [Marinobacter sp. AL4B]MBZ0334623.1 hypothetical protein [Marinobacter sp. AL4B]
MWLLSKLFTHADQPKPRFAFQGTVNWMRGLAILVDGQFSHQQLQQFYQRTQRRQANEQADSLAYECLTMSMHNVSAIDSMEAIEDPYPIVRSAIVAWYYATYYAAKAMLAASSGTDPQTHASAGKVWQAEIVSAGLVKSPFDLSITGITPNNVRQVMGTLRAGNTHDLNTEPTDEDMARGALFSYLKGTAEYEQWRLEEMVKSSREYRQGGFNSFRSNAAKALRDAKLNPANVNYLVQAFRYRGKANYRDAIYLSYGRDDPERLRQFVSDLATVAGAFSLMAAHYVAKRVVRADWDQFIADIEEHAKFELPFDLGEI